MFEYFRNNYTWSLGVMGTINRGGQIPEIDEACTCRLLGVRAARQTA